MKKEKLLVVILSVLLFAVFTHAQFTDWQHSGTIYIITTPEGADLPASASEQNFPLLVRLHKDFFDFSQAKPSGEDIRFASNDGIPLPYQIEEWDAAAGTASIWVKIPSIRGNARKAINMYWGNGGASSESNGEKVFGTDAGFAGVWHLGDNLEDSTPNNLNGTNQGTVNTQGIIGDGRRFGTGTFIGCGDEVSCLPAGNADRSMSAWINPASYESGPTIGGWGKQGAQHLSYMVMSNRGMVKFHGYAADPQGITKVPFGEWHHAALTISGGRIRFYLDGVEDHSTDIVALDTSSASGCYIGKHTPGPGPWARHFQGALDEETIPEPVFTLSPPAQWNGRDILEISPDITNLSDMQAKSAGKLNYNWNVSGIATVRKIEPDKLILKRSQNSGKLSITLALDNGGAATTQTATMMVNEPKDDPWVNRQPGDYEKPEHNQFYARDNNNEGTLYYNGILNAEEVYLKVYADDKLYKEEKQKLGLAKQYAFTVKLKGGLIKYRTEFGTISEGRETLLDTATNLVCGDAYIIQGQSNAEAWADQVHHPYQSEWLRSFGTPITHPVMARQKIWGNAVSFNGGKGLHKLQIGYWGIELAKELIEKHQVPIFIINGAQGGTRVDQHQRNPEDPTDVNTIYGRLLWRLQQAKLTHGIRGVLWHQGEADQEAGGPSGRWGWETYQQYFVDMSASWKQDYPNIQHYYIFQIWPKACAGGVNGSDNMLREVQRTLPSLYSNMSVMSTLGIKPPGGCHYPPEGYAVMAHLICPLVERDNYGKIFSQPITPANLEKAYYTSAEQDEIALEFDQNMVWTNSLTSEFYLDGLANNIASGAVSGNVITLKLKEASSAQKITYLDSESWSQDRLLYGENGIAALTFCDVPIQSRVKSPQKRHY